MARSGPILFITRNFSPALGGIETIAEELTQHGIETGERVVLVHIGQRPCSPSPAGLLAYRHFPGTDRWPALFIATFVIPAMAIQYRPRLIVNVQVTTGLGSLFASRLLGIPYVVLCMGLEILPGKSLLWRGLRGRVLRGARRVISISRFTDSLAAGFGVKVENRRMVNPGTRFFPDVSKSGGRSQVFGAGSETVFVCLSLSRLVPRKGMDIMIEAIAKVIEVRSDILYCIGGSGPDLPRLQALVEAKGLEKHVRFLGRIPDADMGRCYAQADLFVLPSRASLDPPDVEGFGIVFLEAAACGTPSLGGASGGVPDAVLDGETGFLVDPEDPANIAEKILLLMSDRNLLASLSTRARAHAEDSTWAKVRPRYFAAMLS